MNEYSGCYQHYYVKNTKVTIGGTPGYMHTYVWRLIHNEQLCCLILDFISPEDKIPFTNTELLEMYNDFIGRWCSIVEEGLSYLTNTEDNKMETTIRYTGHRQNG